MNTLQVVEYSNQRVLTTQQLAEVYETSTDNIKHNFSRNKDRFVENRDYYLLKGKDLKEFKNYVANSYLVNGSEGIVSHLVAKNVNMLYLWTERGANRHSKILDTDKAWQQFDVLEETYFKVKNNLMPQLNNSNQSIQNNQMFMAMLDMVQNISNNINANTQVLLSLVESMNKKRYKNKTYKNDEQRSKHQSTTKETYSEIDFRNRVNEKLRELHYYTNMNGNAILKQVYSIMKDKYKINLNRLRFDYMRENNVDTLSMLMFISKCDDDNIRNKLIFILNDMCDNKKQIARVSLESNKNEVSIDISNLLTNDTTKEEDTKIDYDLFYKLCSKLNDQSGTKIKTYKAIYKKMDSLIHIDWESRKRIFKEQRHLALSTSISKIDLIKENTTLINLFNNSIEQLLKEV